MIRRNSFCPSELPSATRNLDRYFDIERPHPSLEPSDSPASWTPTRARANSVEVVTSKLDPDLNDLVEELVMPQVDGPAARRKAKKLDKTKKRKKKKGGQGGGKDNVGGGKEENEKEEEEAEDVEEEKCHGDEEGKGDDVKRSGVSEGIVVYGDRGVSKQPKQKLEQAEQEEQGEPKEQDDGPEHEQESNVDRLICGVHGRLLCQFNSACCVHKPVVVGCGCPPRHSCCCVHHAGDCCHCQGSEPVIASSDEVESKTSNTLSVTESCPATPLNNPASANDAANDAANTAAPATVSTTASASSPAKPSGVRLMVTPASPPPSKNIEPVVMGGTEDEETLAVQASLELSNCLIDMMECNHMSDIKLTLRSSTHQFWPIVLTAHKCVLARSPLVTAILKNPRYPQELEEIEAIAGEHFAMIKPWEQVIHYLYGRNMINAQRLKPITLEGLGYDPYPSPECEPVYPFSLQSAMLDMALGYAVSSAFFYLPRLVDTGFRLALDLLSWETVEHLIYFGLCTERFTVVLPPPPLVEEPVPHTLDAAQGEASQVPDTTAPAGESSSHTKGVSDPATTVNLGSVGNLAPTFDAIAAGAEMPFPIPQLQSDWSRRIIAAALGFVIDHITPEFKLYCPAQSNIVPDRIPEFLRTPQLPAATIGVKENDGPPLTRAASSPPHPSAAVSNNPRLADVKFGSFPSRDLNIKRATQEEEQEEEKKKQAAAAAPNTPTPAGKGRKEAAFPTTSPVPNPSPEIGVPSAVLLALDFFHLKMAFQMLSTRGVMSSSLAQGIILERESRRCAALRNYASWLISNDISGNANAAYTAAVEGGVVSGGAKKSKGKGKAKKAKKAGMNSVAEVTASVVNLPDPMKELCYREFFSSKLLGQAGHGDGEVEVEIVLEREWVGFEH